MNRKGVVSMGVIMTTLLFSLIMISLMLIPMSNTTLSIEKDKDQNGVYVNKMNGLERLHSIYSSNISHKDTKFNFKDLGLEYDVSTVSESYEDVTVNKLRRKFYINNKTPITIEIQGYSVKKGPHSYSFRLIRDNMIVYEEKNVSGYNSVTIDESELYNEETGETGYGNYTLEIYGQENVHLAKNIVKYKELKERVLDVKSNNINQHMIILNKSRVKDDIEIKMDRKKGDE